MINVYFLPTYAYTSVYTCVFFIYVYFTYIFLLRYACVYILLTYVFPEMLCIISFQTVGL